MKKRVWGFLLVLPLVYLSGCGSQDSILNELPAQQQSNITKAIHSGGNMHLPTWLPFTPTHSIVATMPSLGNVPTNLVTLSLYDNSELIVIKSPYEALAVNNLPNAIHLKNGVPATFEETGTASILSWANGPTQQYTLYSEKIVNGNPNAIDGPDLSKAQLEKIAKSIH